jgi:hypothetical protein
MTNSLPGGGGVSSVYWYQQLCRRGADRPLAAIVMLAASVTGLVTLVYLTVLGVAVAGSHSVLGGVRGPILIGAVLFLAVRIYFHRPIASGFRWLARRSAGPDERIVAQHVPPREFATLMLLGYLNWLLDCVTLLGALLAVHAAVPWAGVLLAYGLPPTALIFRVAPEAVDAAMVARIASRWEQLRLVEHRHSRVEGAERRDQLCFERRRNRDGDQLSLVVAADAARLPTHGARPAHADQQQYDAPTLVL